MALRVAAGLVLVLVGSLLDVPVAIALGVVVLVLEAIHAVWARYGLRDVHYARHLATDRTAFGEAIPMTIEVWNHKRLPLAWLRADDTAGRGVVVRERELLDVGRDADVLRNAWTLAPFERVVRRFHVSADRRGVFSLGPVDLSVGDPFARRAAAEERATEDRFIVWPRTVPAHDLERPDRWGDADRARSGLAEDPARFAGVRPWMPGDPRRRIHARASARLDRPMTKRFEPSREREVLVALDVQADDGPAWEAGLGDDDVEALYVVAASVARSLAAARIAFGILAAGYTGAEARIARVPMSSAPGQAERVLDLLARLSTHASTSFQRLLAAALPMVRPGTTVLVLTARDPRPFAPALRRLERVGGDVIVLCCGPDGPANVSRARAAGFSARRARLDGTWRSAERLLIGETA